MKDQDHLSTMIKYEAQQKEKQKGNEQQATELLQLKDFIDQLPEDDKFFEVMNHYKLDTRDIPGLIEKLEKEIKIYGIDYDASPEKFIENIKEFCKLENYVKRNPNLKEVGEVYFAGNGTNVTKVTKK